MKCLFFYPVIPVSPVEIRLWPSPTLKLVPDRQISGLLAF
jgi:hypothetical protein